MTAWLPLINILLSGLFGYFGQKHAAQVIAQTPAEPVAKPKA